MLDNLVMEAIDNFQFEGEFQTYKSIEQGYINGTYCVSFKQNDLIKRYILQSINTNIFANPYELMSNIEKITCHIKKKITESSGDPERESLTIIKTNDNSNLYKDSAGNFWRSYIFIEGATAHQSAGNPTLFYNSAKAFGKFQRLLSDFPVDELFETIPGFHDTQTRYDKFIIAVEQDVAGRVAGVKDEIEFIVDRKCDCSVITNQMKTGEIPFRVTHNDTKLNNIMMDNITGEGICVLDLDTVMPGCGLFDFGDSIRFGASSCAEDETDVSKVYMDINLFDEYARGFLSETKTILTQNEIDNLAFASKLITLEQGIRFLSDYINGDTYYKTNREHHNLDRARTQLKLVLDMENKMVEMNDIIKKYSKS